MLAPPAVCQEFQIPLDDMHVVTNGEDVQKIVHRLVGGGYATEPPISSLLGEPVAVG